MRSLYLVVLALLSLASAASAQSFSLDSVRVVLPAGTTLRVDAMDVVASPRQTELAQKFQAAVQQNAAWFQEHLRTRAPGQPLAYDERLGLTRAEYDEFLRLSQRVELSKVAEARLAVRAEGDRLVLDGGTGMPDLTGWAIDLGADQLVTPLGTATGSREVHNDDASAGLGAYDARAWEMEDVSADGRDAKVFSLMTGRLRASGRGFIYSELRQVQGGQQTARFVRILFYDLPR